MWYRSWGDLAWENFGAQHGEGAGLQRKGGHLLEGAWLGVGRGGIEDAGPAQVATARAKMELDRLMMRVEENGKRVADDALALAAHFSDLIAGQAHAEAAGVAGVPIVIVHFGSVGLDPVKVFDIRAVDRAPLEKM